MSTMFSEFEDEKGKVDWQAYHRAQVARGEICRTCGAYIVWGGEGRPPVQCHQCKSMEQDQAEFMHDHLLRCPRCGGYWSPSDNEDYHVYGEDEHSVTCQECNYDFTIRTLVSYTFTSPARVPDLRCPECGDIPETPGQCPGCGESDVPDKIPPASDVDANGESDPGGSEDGNSAGGEAQDR